MIAARRAFYISFLMLSLVFVYFYGGAIPYAFFYLILAIPVISLIYAYICLRGVKSEQTVTKEMLVRGTRATMQISFYNASVLFCPYITARFDDKDNLMLGHTEKVSLCVAGRSHVTLPIEISCARRGEFRIGVSYYTIEDPLGLVRLTRKTKVCPSIIVYPFLSSISAPSNVMFNEISVTNDISRQAEPPDIRDIRSFRENDTIRDIHWKLSAKKVTMLVKEYEQPSKPGVLVVLDTACDKKHIESIEDTLVDCAASIINFYQYMQIPVRLIITDGHRLSETVVRYEHDFIDAYTALALCRFDVTEGGVTCKVTPNENRVIVISLGEGDFVSRAGIQDYHCDQIRLIFGGDFSVENFELPDGILANEVAVDKLCPEIPLDSQIAL